MTWNMRRASMDILTIQTSVLSYSGHVLCTEFGHILVSQKIHHSAQFGAMADSNRSLHDTRSWHFAPHAHPLEAPSSDLSHRKLAPICSGREQQWRCILPAFRFIPSCSLADGLVMRFWDTFKNKSSNSWSTYQSRWSNSGPSGPFWTLFHT